MRSTLLLIAAIWLSLPPASATPRTQSAAETPSAQVTAAEVAVDFVVRDKKGHIVRDLKPSEVEVYEDGVKQEVGVFRLIATTPDVEGGKPERASRPSAAPSAPALPTAAAPATAAAAAPDVPREALVALVFDRLSPAARVAAHDAALQWLKLPAVPGREVGVYRLDMGLDELQPFTDEREPVMSALDVVARAAPTSFSSAEDRERLRVMRRQLALLNGEVISGSTPVASAESAGELVVPGTAATPGPLGGAMRQMEREALAREISMLDTLQQLELDQQGLATTNGLLALVNGLRTFAGRKAVIFFSEGLALPERVLATLGSVISAANRGGVTFYAADAAGLRVRSAAEETRRELEVMASGAAAGAGPMTRTLEHNENLLRLDPSSGLGKLARDTGGFLIRDTNDIALGLRRVEEELGAYYLLSYAPRNESWDGRYRQIEIRVRRPGTTVQGRRGYYAVRTPMPTPVLDHEAPVLAKLEQAPSAAELPLRARALHFPAEDGETVVAVTAEVPASGPSVRAEKSGSMAQDFTVMALVRDASGRVVHKSSRRFELSWPKAKTDEARRSALLFERDALLAPGRYDVQVIAYDTLSGKAGVTHAEVAVPARRAAGRLRLGSLVVIGRSEPNALADPGPLRYEGQQLYPTFDDTVRVSEGRPLRFLVTVAPGAAPPKEAQVELLLGDEAVRSTTLPLPQPDDNGLSRVIGTLSVEGLPPAGYTLRLAVSDGRSLESGTAAVTLAP